MKLEIWHSSLNQEERHYFIEDGGKGYQTHQYVFGYNPQLITRKKLRAIMKIIKGK